MVEGNYPPPEGEIVHNDQAGSMLVKVVLSGEREGKGPLV